MSRKNSHFRNIGWKKKQPNQLVEAKPPLPGSIIDKIVEQYVDYRVVFSFYSENQDNDEEKDDDEGEKDEP